MKKRLTSLSCWIGGIVITISLAAVAMALGWFDVFVLASIIWAIVDSKHVRLWRYHTGLSGGPATVFVLVLILGWPIVLPWYVGMRLKIATGTARLRDQYQPWQMSDSTISPNGLVQPWRGRKI